jgi:hypothetical protein
MKIAEVFRFGRDGYERGVQDDYERVDWEQGWGHGGGWGGSWGHGGGWGGGWGHGGGWGGWGHGAGWGC